MTREEAISILRGIQSDNLNLDNTYTKDKYEAIDMAIKVLEKEPCCDVISRQAVINAIANTLFWLSADSWEELIKCINSIPSIENRCFERMTTFKTKSEEQ